MIDSPQFYNPNPEIQVSALAAELMGITRKCCVYERLLKPTAPLIFHQKYSLLRMAEKALYTEIVEMGFDSLALEAMLDGFYEANKNLAP